MRILLISANTETINMLTLPLGLARLAASTRNAGHEVRLLDLIDSDDTGKLIRRAITEFPPEVIGISVRNIDDQKIAGAGLLLKPVKELVTLCRGLSKAPIILGGAGYSIFPKKALEFLGADMGIKGEGERAFPTLLARLDRNEDYSDIPGLYLPKRGAGKENEYVRYLDLLPLPTNDIWQPTSRPGQDIWLPVQSRRGCALGCSYCATAAIEGRRIRRHSPESVVTWLARWQKAGFKQFFFVDNTFNLPPSYAKELCKTLAKKIRAKIRWQAIIYPTRVDAELAGLMQKAGCQQVALGFESGSNAMLKRLNKRFNTDDIRRTAALFGEHGIERLGFLLLGGPGETRKTVIESLEFADSLALEAMKVTKGIRIYPETALAEEARHRGIIAPDDDLLEPRHFLEPELSGWLDEIVAEWLAGRPNWME